MKTSFARKSPLGRALPWVALAMLILLAILAVRLVGPFLLDPTPTPTATWPMIMCTAPACNPDTENYYCRGECPGGCGTVCATHTPEK